MDHDWQTVKHQSLWMGSIGYAPTIGSQRCSRCGVEMLYAFGCVSYEPGGSATPPPCVPRCSAAPEASTMDSNDNPLRPPLDDADMVVLRRMGARPDDKDDRLDDIRTTAPISITIFADWFSTYEMRGIIERIEFSPVDFADVRKFCRDEVDFEKDLDMHRAGHRGELWHAALWSFKDVPEGRVYLVARDGKDKPLAYGRVLVNRVR